MILKTKNDQVDRNNLKMQNERNPEDFGKMFQKLKLKLNADNPGFKTLKRKKTVQMQPILKEVNSRCGGYNSGFAYV